MMEFVEGVKAKETLGIAQILEGSYEGKKIRMNGAVHNVRDMGEVAFVILRKAEGLVQCVYEEGVTNFDIHDLKEESAVEVLGTVKAEANANPYQQMENEHIPGNKAGPAPGIFKKRKRTC